MEMIRRAIVAGLCIAALGASCVQADAAAPPMPTVASVRVAQAALAPMRHTLVAYGTAEFSADAAQALSVPYQARVLGVAVVAGQAVRKGDALVTLRPTAAAALELQRAGNYAQFARQQLARTRELFAQRLATNTDLAGAEQAAHNAEAALASAQSRLGGSAPRTLRAAHTGVVADIAARTGEVIAADTTFAHIGASSGLRLNLGVEPSAIAQVRAGESVQFSLLQDGAPELKAVVERVGRQIDARTRLIPVVARPDDSAQVPPGAAVSAQIQTGSDRPVLGVPRSAVLYRGGKAYVYVVRAGKAALRWVDAGMDDGTRVEIRAGLAAGETVVVLGNYELQDGMAVNVQ